MRWLLALSLLLAGCAGAPVCEVGGVAPIASARRTKPQPSSKISGPKVRAIALEEINRRLEELTVTSGGVYSAAASTLAAVLAEGADANAVAITGLGTMTGDVGGGAVAFVSTGVGITGPVSASSVTTPAVESPVGSALALRESGNDGVTVGTDSHLAPESDNTQDNGTAALSWKTGYFDTSVVTPSVGISGASISAVASGLSCDAPLNAPSLLVNGVAVGGGGSFTVGLGPSAGVGSVSSTTTATFSVETTSGIPRLSFTGTSMESIEWHSLVMPNAYDNTSDISVSMDIFCTAETSTSTTWYVRFGLQTGVDVSTAPGTLLDTAVQATGAVSGSVDTTTTITFTGLSSGAIDAIGAGDMFFIQIYRDGGVDANNAAVFVTGLRLYQ